ncbi:MAG: Polysaccharide deacetylase [Actinomycetia bacterium]|nr:Polysaccharide deacetylase [Actinomycetes bacterium]
MRSFLTRLLRGRAPTAVLMYHRVGPEARDLHHLRVRDDRFEDHLDVIRRYADIVPLTEVLAPAPRPRVVLTFDDGYADNLNVAEPILRARSAPATVFVAAGVIERGEGFWQDRLAALVLDGHYDVTHIEVEIAGDALRLAVPDAATREEAYRAIHTRIRRRPPAEIERLVADVAAQLGLAATDLRVPHTLTPDDVRTLAASDVVDVGSHTMQHPMMSMIDEATQRAEAVESRARLEAWTGRAVPTFAYPYGAADAFDATSVRVARETGYEIAVTGVAQRVTRFTNPYRVPRRFVGDWDAETFERRFRGWIDA